MGGFKTFGCDFSKNIRFNGNNRLLVYRLLLVCKEHLKQYFKKGLQYCNVLGLNSTGISLVLGCLLVSLEEVGERKMLAKLTVILDNSSHVLHLIV